MRAVSLGAALLIAACRPAPEDGPREQAPVSTEPARADPDLETALARIRTEDLRRHIEVLAADEMKGRATPSPQLDRAAEYVATSMAQVGLAPPPHGRRRIRVDCGASGESAFNVVGVIPGSEREAVLVTAHYDHVGEAREGDDRVFNGANDNASGVSAMLEIADALAHAPDPPRRSIVFVAFCGEEKGLRGSKAFVADPPIALSSLVAVVNLEMLGHPDPSDPKRAWVTGRDYSTLRAWLERSGKPEGVTFVDGSAVGRVEGNAFDRSDNYPFASAGVVAHTIAAGPLDDHYHAVSDEASRVDTDAMVPIVRALARATLDLATTKARPDWTGKAPAPFTRRASSRSRP
ncbi:MAG: M20/M25/M40 family metallo-hydrolase [Nannocystaceae bacterium]|nr:M20/M25/M40 family metallo-hydrolase [bacterium]